MRVRDEFEEDDEQEPGSDKVSAETIVTRTDLECIPDRPSGSDRPFRLLHLFGNLRRLQVSSLFRRLRLRLWLLLLDLFSVGIFTSMQSENGLLQLLELRCSLFERARVLHSRDGRREREGNDPVFPVQLEMCVLSALTPTEVFDKST